MALRIRRAKIVRKNFCETGPWLLAINIQSYSEGIVHHVDVTYGIIGSESGKLSDFRWSSITHHIFIDIWTIWNQALFLDERTSMILLATSKLLRNEQQLHPSHTTIVTKCCIVFCLFWALLVSANCNVNIAFELKISFTSCWQK